MPGKIDAGKAADIIVHGLKKRQLEIRFPFLFTLILRVLGALPASLRLKITSAMARNNQQPETGDRHS
jgi:hypothetical protein